MVGDKKNKIAVVGGGIQGLSAAYFLSKSNNNLVTIFERQNNLGGLLGSLSINGTPIEGFYHHLFNYDYDVIELFKELGLEDKLFYLKSKMGIFYGGEIYSFGSPVDLIKFFPLPFFDRIRTGLCIVYLRFFKNYNKFENIKAVDWLKRHMGEISYKVIWEPLLEGKFGDKKNDITMAWMWSRLNSRAKTRTKSGNEEQLVYPKGGFKQLIDALAKKIHDNGGIISTGIFISKIKKDNNKVVLEINGSEETFDKVIVTTPIDSFIKIVDGLPNEYIEKLQEIKYRAAHVAIMVLNKSLMPGGYYWLNINDRDIPLLAVIEHTNIVPKEDYGGKTIIYLGNYPDPKDRLMYMENKDILNLYSSLLVRINKDFQKSWIEDFFVFKDNAGQPIVNMKYKNCIPEFETPIENLFLLTMAQIYPADRGVSNAVKQTKEFIDFLNSYFFVIKKQ